jgi:hypothetical protein|tara:strand:+ start:7496 stop:9868 length:2373 start_codon:yes stop_codon:yes gene_type:complete
MGSLVKSSLSALSSAEASFCPMNIELDQFPRTFNGGFKINFIQALSGSQSFKNLNYTNFYLTDSYLLDSVTTYNSPNIKPRNYTSTLNFGFSSNAFCKFKPASLSTFRLQNVIYEADNYGTAIIDPVSGSVFEIELIDTFTCRVATRVNNIRYFLVVEDETEFTDTREVLFVSESQLPLSGYNLNYNLSKYLTNSYINLYSTKQIDSTKNNYVIVSDGDNVYAQWLNPSYNYNQFVTNSYNIKLDQELNLTTPSPYNASYITYNNAGKIKDSDSDFNLPVNYLFYSSSNDSAQVFNFLNLKNIVNTQDSFTSSNNLLSTSKTTIFAQDLRTYTSIFSDIDSEENETLALNYVYNNYDLVIKPGTTYFTTPSSLQPFDKININDTKFTDCGSFSFKTPDLSDRVYNLDDNTDKSENVTYLCTWLSGGIGERGTWVDRYFYPDLVSKEEALDGVASFNETYDQTVENLIMTNSSLKTSVTEKYYFDKKSDLIFEPSKRYKYVRIAKDDFTLKSPTNFCEISTVDRKISNYFSTINKNGGFGLGFTLQNDTGDFYIESERNAINGGIKFEKKGKKCKFIYRFFDNSTEGISLSARVAKTTFEYDFEIDLFEKNNVFISFDAILGKGRLYLNSVELFNFELNAFQMYTKRLLFGDIFIYYTNANNVRQSIEILRNAASPDEDRIAIDNVYLSLEPLNENEQLAFLLRSNLNDIQDITISLPCGMRNLTDNINLVNSINTNLKHKSNVVDINIKNLNITNESIQDEVKNIVLTNINNAIPKTTNINDVKFINYKK